VTVTCPNCGKQYDDADRLTFCPHDLIMPAGELAQKKLALSLIGKPLAFAHRPAGIGALKIESVGSTGMVTLQGWSGEFAPHLFVVLDRRGGTALMPAPPLRYYVHYRVPMSEFSGCTYGCWRKGGEQAALAFARTFDRPGCWALVVHPETFTRVAEFGTRFADLVPRKPPARAESAHVQLQLQLEKGGAT
jgi:hypothetical protein